MSERDGSRFDGGAESINEPRLFSEDLLENLAALEHDRAEDDALPEPFGKYRFVRKIGDGGFGDVFLVERTDSLSRSEAMKMIKRRWLSHPEALARFKREQQRLADLGHHPNIGRIFDVGESPTGRAFYTMEHIPDGRIQDFCDSDRQRLTIDERIQLFVSVCRAVQHAHDRGVIHRDIKPGNILIDCTLGQPLAKLVDFGLARDYAVREQRLTRTGIMLGTLAYMPPEQAKSLDADADPSWDVYALGMTLYELVVGALPLEWPDHVTPDALSRYVSSQPFPTPSERLIHLGPLAEQIAKRRKESIESLRKRLRNKTLERVMMKSLAKEPASRYASPGEFAENLDAYLRRIPPPAVPLTRLDRTRRVWRKRRRLVFTCGMVSLVAFLALSAYLFRQRARDERTRRLFEQALAHKVPGVGVALLDLVLESKPSHLEAKVHRAALLWADGRRGEAIQAAEEILRDAPHHAPTHAFLAALYEPTDPARARQHRKHVRGRLDDLYYESLAFGPEDAQKAIEQLNLLLEKGDEFFPLLARAWRHYELRALDNMLEDAKRLARLRPDSPVAWNTLGNAYLERGTGNALKQALNAFDRAISLNEHYAGAYLNRASAKAFAGDLSGAAKDCARAAELDRLLQPYALAVLGEIRRQQGRLTEARAACEEALSLEPDNPVALLYLAKVANESGEALHAHALLSRVISNFRTMPRHLGETVCEAYLTRGRVRQQLKLYEGAVSDCSHALTQMPYAWQPLQTRALAYLALGDFQDATADLREMIRLVPDDEHRAAEHRARAEAGARSLLGLIQCAFLAECDPALEQLDQAAHLTLSPEVLARRTIIHLFLGDDRAAIAELKRASNANPDDRFALYCTLWLRDVLSSRGYNEEAHRTITSRGHGRMAPDWPSTLVAHAQGDVDSVALVSAASDPVECVEAYYYAGVRAKQLGQTEEACEWFQTCLDTREYSSAEFALARLQLLRANGLNH